MKIQVFRKIFADGYTLGEMHIEGKFFAFTCEDRYRGQDGDPALKVKNETCIDHGTYAVINTYSPHFGKVLPLLLNVPCFEGIRIHGGNTAADTEGCILIGKNQDAADGKISGCAEVVLLITDLIAKAMAAKETVTIEIGEAELVAA